MGFRSESALSGRDNKSGLPERLRRKIAEDCIVLRENFP